MIKGTPAFRYITWALIVVLLITALTWESAGLYAVLVLLVIAVVVWPLLKSSQSSGRSGPKESEMYRRLVVACHKDPEIAERLITLEQTKNPELSREECIKRAFSRLADDRGR